MDTGNSGKVNQVGGFKRVCRAALFSFAGLRAAYKGEAAFRQEVWLSLVLIPGALFLPVSWLFKAFLIACMLLVLVVELLNSGLEAVVDLVSPDHHELAGKAKDMGSAAVFVSLLILVVAWAIALQAVISSMVIESMVTMG